MTFADQKIAEWETLKTAVRRAELAVQAARLAADALDMPQAVHWMLEQEAKWKNYGAAVRAARGKDGAK